MKESVIKYTLSEPHLLSEYNLFKTRFFKYNKNSNELTFMEY